jgi:hypothetical protein
MIIIQKRPRLFASVDVQKIQYEKLHPNKTDKTLTQDKQINSFYL